MKSSTHSRTVSTLLLVATIASFICSDKCSVWAEIPTAVKLSTITASDCWTFYPFLNGGGSQQYFSTTSSINTTGLQNPAPQAVYQQLQAETANLTWTADNLSPTTTYKVRVHLSSIQFAGYQNVSETLWV